MQCMSLLRVIHFYVFILANQMFLGTLLVSSKCVDVCRHECIFDYCGEVDVSTFELFASFTSAVYPDGIPHFTSTVVFIFGKLVNIIKGRGIIFQDMMSTQISFALT